MAGTKNVGTFAAKAVLDVSAWTAGAASMSDALKKSVIKNQAEFDKLGNAGKRALLGFIAAQAELGKNPSVARAIRQYNELSAAAKEAFANASSTAVQATIIDPNRGMSRAAQSRAEQVYRAQQGAGAAFVQETEADIAGIQKRAAAVKRIEEQRARDAEALQSQRAKALYAAYLKQEADLERDAERRAKDEAARVRAENAQRIADEEAAQKQAIARRQAGEKTLAGLAEDRARRERRAASSEFSGRIDASKQSITSLRQEWASEAKARDAATKAATAQAEAVSDARAAQLREAQAIREGLNPKLRAIRLQIEANELVRAGVLTQQEATQHVQRQMMVMKGQGEGFSRYGTIVQQAGYQVQDFFVQVASGQNAMVAFSQQSSQMLGFFGKWGAVSGAVISIGVLAYQLYKAAESADYTTKKVKSLADAVNELTEAQQRNRDESMGPNQSAAEALAVYTKTQGELDRMAARTEEITKAIAAIESKPMNPIDPEGMRAEFEGRVAAINKLNEESANIQIERQKKMLELDAQSLALAKAKKAVIENTFEKIRQSQIDSSARDFDTSGRRDALLERMNAFGQSEVERYNAILAKIRNAPEASSLDRANKAGLMDEAGGIAKSLFDRSESIKDSLDPMRERNRLERELAGLVSLNLLSEEERTSYLKKQQETENDRYLEKAMSTFRFDTGASSTGGLASDVNVVNLQKKQVFILQEMLNLQKRWTDN